MIRIGDWMFDFSVMRGWHTTGAFIDLALNKDKSISGKLNNGNKLNKVQVDRIQNLIVHDEIVDAYNTYLAEKELLDVR